MNAKIAELAARFEKLAADPNDPTLAAFERAYRHVKAILELSMNMQNKLLKPESAESDRVYGQKLESYAKSIAMELDEIKDMYSGLMLDIDERDLYE